MSNIEARSAAEAGSIHIFERQQLKNMVQSALVEGKGALNPQQLYILYFRLILGKTQEEAGLILKSGRKPYGPVTRQRVQQIETQTVLHLSEFSKDPEHFIGFYAKVMGKGRAGRGESLEKVA